MLSALNHHSRAFIIWNIAKWSPAHIAFMAIALIHVLPEEIEAWNEIAGSEKVFPLPELLAFMGYTLILVLDKVLFDTHALFDHEDVHDDHGHKCDPAEQKFEQNVRETFESAAQASIHSSPE